MDETNFDQEQAHYHFALGEIVYYISQYGIDSVMTDIYDYLEVEKQKYLKERTRSYVLNNEPTQEYKRGYNAGFEAGELVGKHFHPVKELTDKEIIWVYQNLWQFLPSEEPDLAKDIKKFARAILLKAQEK